jgi:nickel transport protein
MFRENRHNAVIFGLKYNIFCLIFTILWLLFLPVSVSAHNVTVFAWVDGDTIHTQSKFSGGKRVKNAPILVYDFKDVLLLEGKTDENGMFSFKIPQKTSLKIVSKASMGHLAVWKLRAEELGEAESKTAVQPIGMKAPPVTDSGSAGIEKNVDVFESTKISLGKREIEEIINASLDKKLRPITQMLADAMNQKPGFTEIMGGIGYILGLVGIALYFANRKRNR